MERGKYYLSNHQTRIYLGAIAEVSGRYGFEAVLQLAGLQGWIRDLPPDNDALEVDYVDFSMLNATLVKLYGMSGGRTLAMRAGRALFRALADRFAEMLEFESPAFQEQPYATRVEALLRAMIDEGSQLSAERVSLRVAGDQFLYTVEPCPVCWGDSEQENVMCFSTVGFLQQAVEWAGAGDHYLVEEASCAATKTADDAACVFAILKVD